MCGPHMLMGAEGGGGGGDCVGHSSSLGGGRGRLCGPHKLMLMPHAHAHAEME